MGLALPGLAPSFLLRLTDITRVSFALILFGCALGPFPCCLGHAARVLSDSWGAMGSAWKGAGCGLGSVGGCEAGL